MVDVHLRALGRRLRAQREAAEMTQSAAARGVFLSSQTIGRLEDGMSTRMSELHLTTLCDLYGAGMAEREEALALLRRGRAAVVQNTDWQGLFGDLMSADDRSRMALEQHAISMTAFGATLVPTLLQTTEYRRVVEQALHPQDSPDEIERRVRLVRARRLRTNGARAHFYMLESAVRHVIGDAAMMRDQLLELAETRSPRISVQLIDQHAGHNIGLHLTSFALLEFGALVGGQPEPPEVFLDSGPWALRLDREDDLAHYRDAVAELPRTALSKSDSRELLREIAHGYDCMSTSSDSQAQP
ncbi:helix-turn-helix domain-containing protein [Nocardia macrotermitis]|uniref:HTH cro/C1-type domain-containing protein n=1 Tax=Nocardia macrotermitis TaxID=2585198 RepID=A0A7K0DBA3_9NOCA|nr:helix-turn-helix transcriptional regulator [Nocardia macrotermitis]MQY23007.1 hypothetical protein [Nocardia macrotermitis]